MKARTIWRFLVWCLATWLAALQLTGCGGMDFSPDGKHIVFDSALLPGPLKKDDTGLAVIGIDGQGMEALPGTGLGATWSSDGNWIGSRVGNDAYVYNLESKKSKLIAKDAMILTWSEVSGAAIIAIERPDKGLEFAWVDVDSGKTLSASKHPYKSQADFLGWAYLPETDVLAYVMEGSLWIAERGKCTPITKSGDAIGIGAIENGKKLLLAKNSTNLRQRLMTLFEFDVASRSVKKLPFPSNIKPINTGKIPKYISMVQFSPDGKRLAIYCDYAVDKPDRHSEESRSVFITNLDGSHAVTILDAFDKYGEAYVRWSRDATRLATTQVWSAGKFDHIKLELRSADGSNPKTLLQNKQAQ